MSNPPPDPRIPDLISLKEAAEILGVNRQYVHRLVQAGTLRGKQVGEYWVFRRAAVEALTPKVGSRSARAGH